MIISKLHQLRRHRRQKHLTQEPHDLFGECFGVVATLHCCTHLGEHGSCIMGDQRLDHIFGAHEHLGLAPASNHKFERRQRVACRPGALLDHLTNGVGRNFEFGVLHHPAHVVFEFFGGQQTKLQVLRATTNGVAYFLRVGGSQHKYHMWWWFFECL